jgi:hypothetical protein
MLAWSLNPVTRETKAILMMRGATNSTTCKEVKQSLNSCCSVYASHIYTSAFLNLAVGTQLVHFLDSCILSQFGAIRDAEARTGYGNIVPIESKLSMLDMPWISKDMSQSITIRANIHRHLLISTAIIVRDAKTFDTWKIFQLVINPWVQSKRVSNVHGINVRYASHVERVIYCVPP